MDAGYPSLGHYWSVRRTLFGSSRRGTTNGVQGGLVSCRKETGQTPQRQFSLGGIVHRCVSCRGGNCQSCPSSCGIVPGQEHTLNIRILEHGHGPARNVFTAQSPDGSGYLEDDGWCVTVLGEGMLLHQSTVVTPHYPPPPHRARYCVRSSREFARRHPASVVARREGDTYPNHRTRKWSVYRRKSVDSYDVQRYCYCSLLGLPGRCRSIAPLWDDGNDAPRVHPLYS